MYAAGFQCAGCGEWVETSVDESAGSKQQYVKDCQVCCQPVVGQFEICLLLLRYRSIAPINTNRNGSVRTIKPGRRH